MKALLALMLCIAAAQCLPQRNAKLRRDVSELYSQPGFQDGASGGGYNYQQPSFSRPAFDQTVSNYPRFQGNFGQTGSSFNPPSTLYGAPPVSSSVSINYSPPSTSYGAPPVQQPTFTGSTNFGQPIQQPTFTGSTNFVQPRPIFTQPEVTQAFNQPRPAYDEQTLIQNVAQPAIQSIPEPAIEPIIQTRPAYTEQTSFNTAQVYSAPPVQTAYSAPETESISTTSLNTGTNQNLLFPFFNKGYQPNTSYPGSNNIGFPGGNYPGGNYPGGNYPGGNYPGGLLGHKFPFFNKNYNQNLQTASTSLIDNNESIGVNTVGISTSNGAGFSGYDYPNPNERKH